jgi:TRAP-type C4-dicarboxylate transport system substrate-binding protein
VTIQAAELPQALATGVVTTFMTSGATGYDAKVWESLGYFYDTQAWIPKNAVLINAKAFDALDAATKDGLLKAAAEAEARGWKIAEDKNTEYKRLLTERGMKIHKPSTKLDADMRQVGGIMQADWLKVAGADGAAIVDAYKKK